VTDSRTIVYKRIKILRDLNFGRDQNVIESKRAKLAWKLSYDEPISKLPAGKVAESRPSSLSDDCTDQGSPVDLGNEITPEGARTRFISTKAFPGIGHAGAIALRDTIKARSRKRKFQNAPTAEREVFNVLSRTLACLGNSWSH